MLFKVLSAAVLAAVAGIGAASAQTAGDFSGPAELPPASYKGQQYVDSRGCVFLRAGYGGQVNWVSRVSRDRKPLCGYPATFGAKPVAEIAEASQPAGRKPVDTVASITAPPTIREVPKGPRVDPATWAAPRPVNLPAPVAVAAVPAPVAAPSVVTRHARGYEQVAEAVPAPRKIGCFTSAPVPELVRLTNGGTAVVCTRGDGTAEGWRSPIYPAGSPSGPALAYPEGTSFTAGRPARQGGDSALAEATAAPGMVPEGYVAAWKDDRLNPRRGIGTAQGQAAQDEVWTRDVPARLVAEAGGKRKRIVVRGPEPVATVSTKSEPRVRLATQPAAAGSFYVQVGTFGVPANADGVAARLAGAGLPVRKGGLNKGGKALQIVYAGPFASAGAARAALGAARRAGFTDAFIR